MSSVAYRVCIQRTPLAFVLQHPEEPYRGAAIQLQHTLVKIGAN